VISFHSLLHPYALPITASSLTENIRRSQGFLSHSLVMTMLIHSPFMDPKNTIGGSTSWEGENLPEAPLCYLRPECFCKIPGRGFFLLTFVLQMFGLQWTGNEKERLPGMPWDCRFDSQHLAGVGLIFFIAAGMVQSFGFVTKPVLIIHPRFSYCRTELAQCQGFCCSSHFPASE